MLSSLIEEPVQSARTTVYLDPRLYRAAKVKSALTERSLSELVNDALTLALREDQIDLLAFRKRRKDPSRPFENVLKNLRQHGLI